jgi:excisionase family DNA binding protein
MSEVARRLGIGRSTLYRKVRELGLEKHAVER